MQIATAVSASALVENGSSLVAAVADNPMSAS